MPKHEEKLHHRRSNPLFTIFRTILSLAVLAVLFLFLYSAFKGFSGFDPLKISPQAVVKEATNSEKVYQMITTLLHFEPVAKIQQKTGVDLASNFAKPDQNTSPSHGEKMFRFAIVSDTHNDNAGLAKALGQAKEQGAEFIVGLGDFSDVGTVAELQGAKNTFSSQDLPFYLTSGDHDLWDSRNRNLPAITNFNQVFGLPYSSFGYKDARILIFYDSDNYLGIDSGERSWIEQELSRVGPSAKSVLIFTGIPLYHPSSDHVMGKTNPTLKSQAQDLIDLFAKYKVNGIFAGDTHFFSEYTEPKTGLKMVSVGAVTSARNAQAPRFSLVDVYSDGQYTITDTPIK